MTDGNRKKFKFDLNRLSVRMFSVLVAATLLFLFIWLTTRAFIINWVDKSYKSEEKKEERYESYIKKLQAYVSDNEISSNNTKLISGWMKDNRNVYLFLYKDGQLFFDGSADLDEDSDKNEPSGDAEKNPSYEQSGSSSAASGAIGGGISVNYPTRDEILQNAEKNGLTPIEFADGTLLVSIVDSTEYFYYNIANIASLIGGVSFFVIILMLYFTRITGKITRLAKDVRLVYEDDMNIPIRTDEGNDELAVLTRNVEQMRSSMLESLAKEKEALEANSELITSMSHDIRTPLTVLLGYIDIMKETSENSEIKEYLHASEITALRLKELSDDMFKYFLVSGKVVNADISAYDARTLSEQLISEHVLLLAEKNYKVKTCNEINHSTRVKADAQMLMRVIDNVFSNIYKYADRERDIFIKTGEHEEIVFLHFENYIAASEAETESNRIGLRSSAKLCDAMGAHMFYEESDVADGKIFTLKIELSKEENLQCQ